METVQVMEYQVSPNGEVRAVQVKTVDGADFRLPMRRGGTASPFARNYLRNDKWGNFMKAICSQETGLWYIYGPFADEHELVLAKSAAGRWRRNKMLQARLRGKEVSVSYSKETLELGILVTDKD